MPGIQLKQIVLTGSKDGDQSFEIADALLVSSRGTRGTRAMKKALVAALYHHLEERGLSILFEGPAKEHHTIAISPKELVQVITRDDGEKVLPPERLARLILKKLKKALHGEADAN